MFYPDETGNCPEDYAPLPEVAGVDKSAARAMWAAVEAACWVRAARALAARNYALMRAVAEQADKASRMATPSSALLDAIFGPNAGPESPDDKLVREGNAVDSEIAATAKKLVQDEMAAHTARQAARHAAERAAQAATRRAEQSARAEEVRQEAASALTVGAEYRAEVSYKLVKATSAVRSAKKAWLCQINGITVSVINDGNGGIADGETVVIKSLKCGRAWGIKYAAEAAKKE